MQKLSRQQEKKAHVCEHINTPSFFSVFKEPLRDDVGAVGGALQPIAIPACAGAKVSSLGVLSRALVHCGKD